MAENRPLASLCQLVGHSMRTTENTAQVMITEKEFHVHFMVFKRELERLLNEDPKCKDSDGKPLFEILHFKDDGNLILSEVLLKTFDEIQNSST